MTRYKLHSMTFRAFRHFLSRFDPDLSLKLMFLDEIVTRTVDFPLTIQELIHATCQQDDDDPVLLSSSRGVLGVWGFISDVPPVLCCGLTTDSIQRN